MRGISDRDVGQWPLRPACVGVNDIWLFNRETGEGIEREAKVGEYGSPERKAQNDRLTKRAAELNRELEFKAKEGARLAQNPYSWHFDTRGEVQPEIPPTPEVRVIPAYGVVCNG